MKEKLTIEDLAPPNCGLVVAKSKRPSEYDYLAGHVPYHFVMGGITKRKLLVVPSPERYVSCWHCVNPTKGRWMKRDLLGYVLEFEVVCPVCFHLRERGIEGVRLYEMLDLLYARWRREPDKFETRLEKWKTAISAGKARPTWAAADAVERRKNIDAMSREMAARLEAMSAQPWPTPAGWVLTAREYRSHRNASLAAFLEASGEALAG